MGPLLSTPISGVRTEACSTGKTNRTGQEQRQLDSRHSLRLSPQEALRWSPYIPAIKFQKKLKTHF